MSAASLATTEAVRLSELEATIERGLETFVEVGQALGEIRESRLYRESHSTFESYCRERWEMSRVSAHRHIEAAEVVGALPIGNKPANEAQARELVPLLREDEAKAVEVWGDLRQQYGERVTAEKVREAVQTRLRREQFLGQVLSSRSYEWYTPARYVKVVRELLGEIDLDPASSSEANETIQARRYFAVEDDGLAHEWPGRVFLNPPYGALAGRFVARLLDQYEAGITRAAIVLLSSNATETEWFRPLFDHTLCFTDHRIDYDSPTEKNGQPTHGSVFAYLGPDDVRFARTFSRFGAVVVRHPAAENELEEAAAA